MFFLMQFSEYNASKPLLHLKGAALKGGGWSPAFMSGLHPQLSGFPAKTFKRSLYELVLHNPRKLPSLSTHEATAARHEGHCSACTTPFLPSPKHDNLFSPLYPSMENSLLQLCLRNEVHIIYMILLITEY